ncbi:MAG: 23S rRNA (pseudouridine(1915)-N(3))-methyltransferase RlmH [Clostridia bacterium]|nr:23S rRNA (pseudouridine(1915)-N(3))-methyltransferase RlmH [Clostridia bacterium]
MEIKIVAVGKLKERYWAEAASEYRKRLRPYAHVSIIEVKDRPLAKRSTSEIDPAQAGLVLKQEAQDLEKEIGQRDYLVCLTPEGKMYSSEELAEFLRWLESSGQSTLTMVIGGTLGIDPGLKAKAELLLSLSRMTFPHQLSRVMLLEQLYRAFKILRHEPYHR